MCVFFFLRLLFVELGTFGVFWKFVSQQREELANASTRSSSMSSGDEEPDEDDIATINGPLNVHRCGAAAPAGER